MPALSNCSRLFHLGVRNAPSAVRLNILTLEAPLEARDLPKVRSFYEALGWQSLSNGEEFRLQTGGATLALFLLGLLAAEANLVPWEDSGRLRGFTCAVLVEQEQMVDEAMGVVREAGGRVLADPVALEWGERSGGAREARSGGLLYSGWHNFGFFANDAGATVKSKIEFLPRDEFLPRCPTRYRFESRTS